MFCRRVLFLFCAVISLSHFLTQCENVSGDDDDDDVIVDLDKQQDKDRIDIPPAASAGNADDLYKSSKFVGHSLWLVPSTEATKIAYQTIVNETAAQLGTESFTPHITLLAAIRTNATDVVARTKALASVLTPYTFHLETISYKDAYFQCVFAKFYDDTNANGSNVMEANALARRYFPEKVNDPPYMPHLSLVYGNQFTKQQKEEELIPTLKSKIFPPTNNTNNNTTTTTIMMMTTTKIHVNAMEVWSTQGYVSEWYLVERIPFSGNQQQQQSSISSSVSSSTTTTVVNRTATTAPLLVAKLCQGLLRVWDKLWNVIRSVIQRRRRKRHGKNKQIKHK